jgi:RNA polymerase sigma factor (sigma-70 family)
MSDQSLNASIRGVLLRIKVREVERLSDAELLSRYAVRRDEAAFTALVGRHGPTVLGVCRRVLRADDVDDAFQATFLTLAKQAGTIRRREAIGAWLYEVAYHTALRARTKQVRSQLVERSAAAAEAINPEDEIGARDFQRVFDEELHQLPERLREPLVLVHLLGHVQANAARELGITDRALRKRLRAGRERLRRRLSRRGVGLTVAALAATSRPAAASLIQPTVQSALAYAAGQTGAVPAAAMALAAGAVGGAYWGKLTAIALLVAVPVLAGVAYTARALTPVESAAPAPPEVPSPIVARAEAPAGRTSNLTGQILDIAGRPVPHAAVTALVRRPWQATDRAMHDDVVAQGTADANGRYHLSVPADFPTWSADRRVNLLAYAPGHAPITGEVSLSGAPCGTELRLPARSLVIGRLLTPDGGPATDVRLGVVRLGLLAKKVSTFFPAGWPPDVTTDSAGAFRLDDVPAGENLWLQVRDERFALTTFPVKAGVQDNPPVTLSGPRWLTGRITAADTGRPLPGARIAVIVGPERNTFDYYTALSAAPNVAAAVPPAELETQADSDGQYRLRLPPGTAYHVYVYPPEGAAYLGWHWRVTWDEGEPRRERTAALQPGIEVRGDVVEENGHPISGAAVLWMSDVPAKPPALSADLAQRSFPDSQSDALVFADTATMSGADGRFRIVVPANPFFLRVFGPTADYRLYDYAYQRCPQCGKPHLRPGEHARIRIDPTKKVSDDLLRVTLRRGQTVIGRAVGPDGEPIREGVLVCRSISQPLRKPAPRLLPIRDGHFELPGCIDRRIYPVLLLDASNGLAAVAELRVTANNDPAPTVRLARCGAATVRFVQGSPGRPLADHRPTVWFWLPDDRPADLDVAGNGPWSNPIDASWVDSRHFLFGPATDAEGMLALPVLAPGLQYHVAFAMPGAKTIYSEPFRVTSGQTVRLPDIVAPAEIPAEAEPPIEKLPKQTGPPALK